VERLQSTLNTATESRVLAEERQRSEDHRRALELRKLRYEQRDGDSAVRPSSPEEVQARRQLRATRLELL
jgi:hypothetical protein